MAESTLMHVVVSEPLHTSERHAFTAKDYSPGDSSQNWSSQTLSLRKPAVLTA